MSYMKSIFPVVMSMLFIADVYAWYPVWLNNPGYYGPYTGEADSSLNVRKGVHLEKDMDEQGYVLRIHLSGMSPEAIESRVVRGALLLRSSQSSMSRNRSDYGERTFSHSFSINKRIRLPYNADISRMERNDSAGLIEIRFPRRHWN